MGEVGEKGRRREFGVLVEEDEDSCWGSRSVFGTLDLIWLG